MSKELEAKIKQIKESKSFNDKDIVMEATYHALAEESSEDFYENCSSETNKARAKVITANVLGSKEFIRDQKVFINRFSEAASNTSVQHIASFRKLLPELIARSANMALSLENVAHIVDMPTNSMLLPIHRRLLGASDSTLEALYNAVDSSFGGTGTHAKTLDPFADSGDTDTTPADGVDDAYAVGTGNTRVASENLTLSGMDKVSNSIAQIQLTAESRNSAMTVSTEALEDAQNEYGVNLIREGLITMQAEMYRAISAQAYGSLALLAKKEVTFDFATTGTDNADNFILKNAYLYQYVEQMRAEIQREAREPGLKFRIFATSKVCARLKMIDRLHVPLTNPATLRNDFDNISFFRGYVGEFELYELVETNGGDMLMVVGKGNRASNSPLIYGNYSPFTVYETRSPDTSHSVFFGKIRSGLVGNPLTNDNDSETLLLANQNTSKYARAMRIVGI